MLADMQTELEAARSSCSKRAVSAGTVKITGGTPEYDTTRAISCAASGGLINVRVRVKGTPASANMWGLWIDDLRPYRIVSDPLLTVL